MAVTTASALQSALDTIQGHDIGTISPIRVLKEEHDAATYSRWYVVGQASTVSDLVQIFGPRALWAKTTVANSVADQAAEVVAAMKLDSNVDPDAEV